MPLPISRAVPTALLARGGRRAENGLPELDRLLQSDADPFVPAPPRGGEETAVLQVRPEQMSVSPAHLYELGLTTAAMGFHTAAIEALRNCTARAPDHAFAWRKLAELLRLAGEDGQANDADAAAERTASSAGKWKKAVVERTPSQLEKAERRQRESLQGRTPEDIATSLRDDLAARPLDVTAMRFLAHTERKAGDEITSMRLLERALDLCPDYIGARENYAELLVLRRDAAAAAVQTARLLAHAPRSERYRNLYANAMIRLGDLDAALDVLADLLREHPGQQRYWLGYAKALHFVGRRDESVQAYRRCLGLQPDFGEAYFGLADLKGNYITDADIAAMRAQLEEDALEPESRMYMLYALAQTLERAGDFGASFAAYDEGARLSMTVDERRVGKDRTGSAEERSDSPHRVRRVKAVYSRENLETRLAQAAVPAAPDTPIFVVGLPRAGSTLTEQILASHSLVEGTRELPLVGDITRDLATSRMLVVPNAYPECILDLTANQLAALGARYIESARDYRKTDRPYFIDKRPWNWLEVGLIHLMLPHAKIIDIRREPMAAGFAVFKQLLPEFSLSLHGCGRYYNNYVSLMEHWQSVLPGRVHFVQYERLVEDTENEIRGMLDYCGLPFEEGCLRFWETERAISTPSAEQVRRPIFRDALQQWRNFEPWLGPLREGLNQPADD